jgi:putative redox protein
MDAQVIWNGKLQFTGSANSGFQIPLDAGPGVGGEKQGFSPMELLLIGLAGCTGMDVISILQKKRQPVTSFDVRVHADRAREHPRVFTHIVVEYIIGGNVDPAAVARAVELSVTKYCPAEGMFGQIVTIEHHIRLVDAGDAAPAGSKSTSAGRAKPVE